MEIKQEISIRKGNPIYICKTFEYLFVLFFSTFQQTNKSEGKKLIFVKADKKS
jgi:hypothetical protein